MDACRTASVSSSWCSCKLREAESTGWVQCGVIVGTGLHIRDRVSRIHDLLAGAGKTGPVA